MRDALVALPHAPDILFLDEPAIGLDTPFKLAVRNLVRRAHRERGTTPPCLHARLMPRCLECLKKSE